MKMKLLKFKDLWVKYGEKANLIITFIFLLLFIATSKHLFSIFAFLSSIINMIINIAIFFI